MNANDVLTGKRKGAVQGIRHEDPVNELDCYVYLKSKMVRNSVPKKSIRRTSILDLAHIDVCGPMRIESIGHARFFIEFIDDKLRCCKVQFLNSRTETVKTTTE